MIALSLPLFFAAYFVEGLWPIPTALFVIGWIFQFVGHRVEGKPPGALQELRVPARRVTLVGSEAARASPV